MRWILILIIINCVSFSGLFWTKWPRGSCTSNWSGFLCCPSLRNWTRYRNLFRNKIQSTTWRSKTLCVAASKALAAIKADRGYANDGLSSAVLVLFLDSARNLPVSQLVSRHRADQLQLDSSHVCSKTNVLQAPCCVCPFKHLQTSRTSAAMLSQTSTFPFFSFSWIVVQKCSFSCLRSTGSRRL